jgi:hypothetical protein
MAMTDNEAAVQLACLRMGWLPVNCSVLAQEGMDRYVVRQRARAVCYHWCGSLQLCPNRKPAEAERPVHPKKLYPRKRVPSEPTQPPD